MTTAAYEGQVEALGFKNNGSLQPFILVRIHSLVFLYMIDEMQQGLNFFFKLKKNMKL